MWVFLFSINCKFRQFVVAISHGYKNNRRAIRVRARSEKHNQTQTQRTNRRAVYISQVFPLMPTMKYSYALWDFPAGRQQSCVYKYNLEYISIYLYYFYKRLILLLGCFLKLSQTKTKLKDTEESIEHYIALRSNLIWKGSHWSLTRCANGKLRLARRLTQKYSATRQPVLSAEYRDQQKDVGSWTEQKEATGGLRVTQGLWLQAS